MPKFVIEREVPGAGQMTAEELHGIAAKSNTALEVRTVPDLAGGSTGAGGSQRRAR